MYIKAHTSKKTFTYLTLISSVLICYTSWRFFIFKNFMIHMQKCNNDVIKIIICIVSLFISLNAKSIVHLTTQFQDFKSYAENGTLEDNPVLERSVSLFNGLSQWIQSVVLNRATPSQRADVIAKFVHVAKVRFFDNFNHHNNHRTFLFFYLLRKRNYCQKII